MQWRALLLVVLQHSVLCWAFAWNAFPNAAATTGIRLARRRPSKLLAAKASPGDRLLWTEGLTKMYTPDRHQLKDVSLTLTSGQRAGLVGINGAGKSTLLKILAGIEQPDSGTISTPKGTVVSYAEQEPPYSQKLIREVLFGGDDPLMSALLEYYTVMQDDVLNMDKFQETIDKTHDLGHLEIRPLIDELEEAMGMDEDEWDKPMNQLSGGQRRKIGLMRAFLQRPDVLLLDEPTNHLDVDTIDWLVSYLKRGSNKHMAVLTITHDRYFLDALCSDIYELDRGNLFKFSDCNYSRYVEQREKRLAAEEAKLENAKAELAKEKDYVSRQPKGRQAKNRGRVDRYEQLKAQVESGVSLSKPVDLSVVGESIRLGGSLVELKRASLRIGYHVIFNDFNFTLGAGDTIGVVGDNGAGKSSLLRALMGETPLDNGALLIGKNVRFGYYDQRGIQLAPDERLLTVFQFVEQNVQKGGVDSLSDMETMRLLSAFQFPTERWHSLVSDLSGGERRRLQLLQVLALQPNVLVLDEPTNDLDLATLEALEKYVEEQFEGALICVSHDRFFMDRMVNKLLAFKSNGHLVQFDGTYTQYLTVLRKERQAEKAAIEAAEAAARAAAEAEQKRIAAKQAMYAQFQKKKSPKK